MRDKDELLLLLLKRYPKLNDFMLEKILDIYATEGAWVDYNCESNIVVMWDEKLKKLLYISEDEISYEDY